MARSIPRLPQKQYSQLADALWALKRGFRVFPLDVGSKKPNGRLVPRGVKESTRDEAQVRQWWAANPYGNVGIHGGVIVDCDSGIHSLEQAEGWRERAGFPATLAVRTGRRTSYGVQYHYRGRTASGPYELDGVTGEVRSGNLYGLAPGSIHPDTGEPYQVAIDLPMADYPTGTALERAKSKIQKNLGKDPNSLKPGQKIQPSFRQFWLVSQCGRLRRTGLSGEPLFQALRALCDKYCEKPEEKSDAMLRQICESGERNYGVHVPSSADACRVPFNLSDINASEYIVIVDDEQDCITAREEFGLVAITTPIAAGNSGEEFNRIFQGKNVTIIPDNEKDRLERAEKLAAHLYGKVKSLAICHVPEGVKRLSDWPLSRQSLIELIKKAPRWFPGASATEREENGEWPDPSPLGDELPPVLAFTPELLPKSFLPLVEDISERMQTPMDYAAAAAIVALASCVNRRARMQPKAEDTSWLVIPNLWGAIIAPPGMMKSPNLRAVTLPLTRIEESWHIEYQSTVENFELEKECADLRHQAWKEDYKRATKKGGIPPVQPDKSLSPPTQRRLILTDATFEKLHEILAENSAGVLVLRDELTGWVAALDKPGREGERAFYLEAWNGDTGFSVDRIGRGSIYVPAVCVSLLGNIQPARLRWYLSDAITGGPNDDGLFQRFQILVWPDLPSEWKLIDRPPDSHALAIAERVFSALATLSADCPVRMCFDPDSQQLFFSWLTELECKVRRDSGLHPAMVAHLSKYRSLMPSLAALFELADRAAAHDEFQGQITVSLEHAKQAAALCEYLESHARRVYACIVSPECRAAHELGRHIQAGDLSNPFKTRDVYLKGWSGLDDPGRVRSAIELLEEAAWVRREETPKSQSGGRPSEMWRISPKVVHREK